MQKNNFFLFFFIILLGLPLVFANNVSVSMIVSSAPVTTVTPSGGSTGYIITGPENGTWNGSNYISCRKGYTLIDMKCVLEKEKNIIIKMKDKFVSEFKQNKVLRYSLLILGFVILMLIITFFRQIMFFLKKSKEFFYE